MDILVSIVTTFAFGTGTMWLLKEEEMRWLKREVRRISKEKEAVEEEASTLESFNKKMSAAKEDRKEKIMERLTKFQTIRTKDVSEFLDISRASAYRYLEELEQEGKIRQVRVLWSQCALQSDKINASIYRLKHLFF